jgi:hypothetical protein
VSSTPSSRVVPPSITMIWPPKPSALDASSPSTSTLRLKSATSARSSTERPSKVCTLPQWV